jgi:type IV pilus assembly protein PilB
VVNFAATVAALGQFAASRVHHTGMAWRKTEHVYPRPRLGELLVRMRAVPMSEVEKAAGDMPAGLRIGEYLVELRKLSEADLYRALSIQSGIADESAGSLEVDRRATRILPAEVARRWSVLPFRVEMGHLHVAVADVPPPGLTRELARFSSLEIRYRLVLPAEFARLEREYLPPTA